ncbi:MAG: hypothetical protein JOY90_15150 [Bradyrhizobium sp.]|uniref:hypothetical protein n=1 Tax=Bradyrhizobium sp. TaxID=376 RepID=UPI001DB357DA|nr:hypothetical protein [Bradyrhizobium sp.]MBV9561764.1 hypothetical protein [Bradyrhizobium sp.]
MGTFVTNLHVHQGSREHVVATLRSLRIVPAYVRGSGDVWISIFPEAADQDDAALPEMARALSKALNRPVIAFIVHDSDVFLYWLYEGGKELDRYNSAPGFFTDKEAPPEGGNPEKLKVCRPPNFSKDQLWRLLHPEEVASEQPVRKTDRAAVRDAVRKKLRQSYPALAAKMPNPPSLEEFLAQAETRWADMEGPNDEPRSAAKEFVFAEDRMVELAKLLGIPDGPVIDSYRYLVNGEGAPGTLTLVQAEGESSVRIE